MKLHYLNTQATFEEIQNGFIFYCEKCEFDTFGDILFTRHIETKNILINKLRKILL